MVDPSLGGKYMTFKLADEEYGFEILNVREIIGMMDITRVPKTPDYIRGVINLRGKVHPVVDLRLKFGMPETIPTEQTVIIVVQCQAATGSCTMGILVDEVLEVLNVEAKDIEPPPKLGGMETESHDFILGVGKVDHRVIFLLDIGKVLNQSEFNEVATAAL
ncbi:MAG: purine-binding chemotaxis protein CheW, partial [Deltaproteobacteria bacterium]|nr:purine-binding chemotaxis protein CheW [Deltaproteobacteria bacterium]